MDGNSRKTDTESTQYITHSDVGASTITECRQPDIPQRKSNSGITLDTHPLSRQTTHHLLKDIEGIKEHNRESGEFWQTKPSPILRPNRNTRRHSRSVSITDTIWNSIMKLRDKIVSKYIIVRQILRIHQ